jgi:hypothetical protein
MAGHNNILWGGTQVATNCVHKFEDWDFGTLQHCMFCGLTVKKPLTELEYLEKKVVMCGVYENVILHEPEPCCPDGAEQHHRSCALRLGGNSCTC